ncbi:MAG: DUF58 domain-containing protein [Myxococcales bacterium]|nr:DUF58 domain-containing protein [Myxococcales bacterium]
MRPTLRALLLFAGGIPAALVAVLVHPRLWTVWLAYLAAVVVIGGLDALLALPRRRLAFEVEAPAQIFIGDRGVLRVTLRGRGWKRPARVGLLAELDDDLEPQPLAEVTLMPVPEARHAEVVVELPLVPRRRGNLEVVALHLKWTGPMGLMERRTIHVVGARVAVVPNVGAVRAVAARMFSSREFLAGLKVERYIGDGSEFESLREYVPGLDHRAIDWKASARHIKLLCQEFRAERNHQVVMAIDAGHLMSEPLDGIPRLDHAINAGLLLSWFCLRTGDRVGLVGFDDQIRTWADPLGGVHNFARLQHLTADLAYRRVETNFTLALAEITTRLRRRSLVVLITDFLDTITAELMVENVLRLSRRHLVLFVALRDPGLERRALAVPRSVTTLHEAVVANDFARERQIVIERLRLAGVHCIDTEPARFSMNLLNRYLDIKRRELI